MDVVLTGILSYGLGTMERNIVVIQDEGLIAKLLPDLFNKGQILVLVEAILMMV